MKNLQSILKAVSRGKMDVTRAESLILELFEASSEVGAAGPGSSSQLASIKEHSSRKVETAKSTVDAALAQLGEKVGIESLLKKSKLLGSKLDFRPGFSGFESRLSIFSEIELSTDSHAEGNIVSGSQWKSASFDDMAEINKNHFTLSQITQLKCNRSNFSSNEFGLARLSKVTIAESRFENNRLSRSQCVDVSLAESDFTHNRLLRSEFTGVVLNASRLAHVVLRDTRWQECEFEQSDIQGLKFENCAFDECRFSNCEIVSEAPVILEDLKIKGKTFEGIKNIEDFLAALEYKPRPEHNAARSSEHSAVRRTQRRSKTHRDKR